MKLLKILNLAVFSALLLTALDVQIVKGKEFYLKAAQNFLQKRVVVAERGFIKDRNGVILAQSLPSFRVVIDFTKEDIPPDISDFLSALCASLKLDAVDLEDKVSQAFVSSTKRFVLLSNIPQDSLALVETAAAGRDYVVIESEPVRFYPLKDAFSHILGFVGEVSKEEFESGSYDYYLLGEATGKDGLEKSFENKLRGVNGVEVVEIDARGGALKVLSRKEPVRGATLNLTIDAKVQQKLYEILKEAQSPGSIIVSAIDNGDLLAAVNYPSFDNNLFSLSSNADDTEALLTDPTKPLFNRFLSGLYPPGSVFKIVIATAALAEGVITKETKIEAAGAISYGSFTYKDWSAGGHGFVNVVSALARSADTFFYQIGGGYKGLVGLGVERIAKWARNFGFGSLTGIELPGEVSGLVPTEEWKEQERGEPWYIGNTYHLSIGQGDLLATPLQTNLMTNIVASGGKIYRPNLVEGGSLLEGYLEAPKGVLEIVKEGMVGACNSGGTAYPLFEYGGSIACKTGTSETSDKEKTHAWLTMFYPASAPQYAVTVFLENGGGGAQDAAPVARQVYEFLLAHGYN